MKRLAAIVMACVCLAACTTTNTKVAFENPTKPAPGARIILLTPDVQLALLTASGMNEPREDWSRQARGNLAAKIETGLKARAHQYEMLDPDTVMTGKVGQLLRLHGAVGQSILSYNYGAYSLPTKKAGFDWTLGPGAQELGAAHGAEYALFVTGRGTYASSGRVATMIGLSLLGVSVPLGSQQVFASLVDLRTGQVIWFNVAVAGPNADMREDAGAASLVDSLLKKLPL